MGKRYSMTEVLGGTEIHGGTGGTTEVQGDTPAVSPKVGRKALQKLTNKCQQTLYYSPGPPLPS